MTPVGLLIVFGSVIGGFLMAGGHVPILMQPSEYVVICGAGPSLRDTAAKWCQQADQVWGCNSAATWLYDNGHKVTHGFTVDGQVSAEPRRP